MRKLYSLLFFVVSITFFATSLSAQTDDANPQCDPSKVMGAAACVKCHAAELKVWQNTPHYQTFKELHRKPEAKAIAKRMGIRSIKRGGTCIKCHYTQQLVGDKVKAISGISCESCHGASKDWIELHNDYGGPNVSRLQESADHRQKRREVSIANGMCNPSNLYLIAKNCLNCHTTPNEKLVNVGKHPTGSLDFELVAWSQGMVRHNFVHADGHHNAPPSRDRLRVMYVVGLLADLEFSLRATALATQKAKFGITNAKRANTMKKKLIKMQGTLNNPILQDAVTAVSRVTLKLNNRDELLAAAEQVSQAAFTFAEKTSGAELAAIDVLLPSPKKYKYK